MRVVTRSDGLADVAGCVLVPTMGALHQGHGALIERGRALARERGLGACVVSVFVNPTQFNDKADFARYPRVLERDAALAARSGADVLWTPEVEGIYPGGAQRYAGPMPSTAQGRGLEDAARPGHFAGVCQVVGRLVELARPAIAVFGEKDWQQLAVVRELVATLGMDVEVHGHATVREGDGLAMSSRNVFLGQVERVQAASLRRALVRASRCATAEEGERAMRSELQASGVSVDYATIRDARTLEPVQGDASSVDAGGQLRALVAGRLGSVRLLDNEAWPIDRTLRES